MPLAGGENVKILIVEDEPLMRDGLRELFAGQGFTVLEAITGPEGLVKARDAKPDLVVLDGMLPGLSGFDVLRTLRAEGRTTPVVMLTARGTELDKVMGFQLGVDDYVTKPFSVLELLGRVQAVLRRTRGPMAPVPAGPAALTIGLAEADFERLELRKDGLRVELPARAVELLQALAAHDGRIVGREALIDQVWGADQAIQGRRVDNLVVLLRQAIEPDPTAPVHLLTVHGRGYRLVLG
jgi:DNA-binding response OmpR family regulator